MKAFALVLCLAGGAVAYYAPQEAVYNVGPGEPAWGAGGGYLAEPSQRLFWGNSASGTNQVGGTGLWAHFTNKFPFLATMFGRLEQGYQPAAGYQPDAGYGAPSYQPAAAYGAPSYQPAAAYGAPVWQPQLNYVPQYHQGHAQAGRGVGFTDDAVIITPPEPAPEPEPGYQYARPQQRFQLPQK